MLAVIIVIITCAVNLMLGGLVLLRNPRRQVSISFFLISFFISVWAISNLLTSDPHAGLTINQLFNKFAFFSAFLAVGASVWFCALFPRRVEWSTKSISLLLVLGFITAVMSLTSYVAGDVLLTPQGKLHFTVGSLLLFYVAVIALFLFLIAKNLITTLKKTRGQVRQQALLLLIAFSVPIVIGLILNAILPSITADWQTANIGPAFTIILVGLISFAIVKHHLFDIRLAIARSFAYVMSVAAVSLLYAVIAFSISGLFLGGKITVSQEIFFALFSAFVAFLFQPLKRYFDKITNKLFYQDAYDAQGFIDQVNRSLVAYTDLDHLLIDTATIMRDNFKAEFCLFGVADPNNKRKPLILGSDRRTVPWEHITLGRHLLPDLKDSVIVTDNLSAEHAKLKLALEENNIALLVHLTAGPKRTGESLGYLLLGNKKSGNPYNNKDINILDILANGLVIALQNAYRFEEIKGFTVVLQEKVDEATRKLRHTNDRLRTLDQTKDDFISMASHQLRTPLTSVKGYVSMVLDGDAGKISSTQRKLLNQSFLSSQRMVYLISDLLNVSRLKTGKFIIEPVETDLAKVIEEEVEQLTETVKSRNLALKYHKPEHFPTLMIDETKIRQVMMNFIDNAVYYTPAGGHINVYLVDKGTAIEFTVVDDGIGVPKSEQHHLFSKFYRAHNAKRARPDGTGLGIFMAKKVIIAQGGAVIFRSQEGKGSTFGFTFAKKDLLPLPKGKHHPGLAVKA